MSDELLPYYNRELAFIRRMGAEFAQANPKIAGRLRVGADSVEDPHVSRLIESVAFLNARIRRKLDDDFPELTDAMLGLLYPHYQRPVPSMAIVQFTPKSDLSKGYELAEGSPLETEGVDGEPCRFRTCYPTTLWPIEVQAAGLTGSPIVAPELPELGAVRGAIRISLRCAAPTMTFEKLGPDTLRFFLRGQSQHVFDLYELIFNELQAVAIAKSPDDREPHRLSRGDVTPVGFHADEGMVPYPSRSFVGYRLLSEFFTFPRKFLFFDVRGITPEMLEGYGEELDIYFYLRKTSSDLEHNVDASTFATGCVPVVNLYTQRAEPIELSHATAEYRVIPDARRPHATEVYSIDSVKAVGPDGTVADYLPFYGVTHATAGRVRDRFWAAQRRAAGTVDGEQDPGTEVFLSVVDLDFSPAAPQEWVLDVETTCLNRNLPTRLPFGGGQPRLQLSRGGAPIERLECLTPPTPTHRAALRHGAYWRLISHLSLNHLSLTGDDGAAALREILLLYDFRDSAETRAMIEGLVRVQSRAIAARTPGEFGGVCRGTEIAIELDADRFSGSGMFLFACVLERFLGLYSSVNSFNSLVATVKGREGVLRRWAPRAGEKTLL